MRNTNLIDHPPAVALEARRAAERIFTAVRLGASAAANAGANAAVANIPWPDENDASQNSRFNRTYADAATASYAKAYLIILEEAAAAAEAAAAKAAGHETWAAFEANAFFIPEAP
jgi:hypothetical protein